MTIFSVLRPRSTLRLAALLTLIPLAGCASFGRGVTEALLERDQAPSEDFRACSVEGLPFAGIEPYLARQDALPPIGDGPGDRRQVKVIYVHGIGTHEPTHGTDLVQNLAASLELDVRSPRPKRIKLVAPDDAGQELGEVNILRFTDNERRRDLVFYELTWSPITDPAKESIAFDSAEYYKLQRASINQSIRLFVNDVAPDPIAFAGNRGDAILTSIRQASCWAISKSWSDMAEVTTGEVCEFTGPDFGSRLDKDDFVYITHSLGSRATVDALQSIAENRSNPQLQALPAVQRTAAILKDSTIQVFMLSNQLPLLEAGQDPQAVTGEQGQFCGPTAPRANERFVGRTQLIAFSDPNDVMSYPIPQEWAADYLESRLCPEITNVTINIAHVQSAFGLGEFADPLQAHLGYAADARVGGLIANGAGHDDIAPIVAERCRWLATDESLMQ